MEGVIHTTLQEFNGAFGLRGGVATQITVDPTFIALRFTGYGAHAAASGEGDVIYIEVDGEGHPVVHVWDDIEQEDAGHSISLKHAVETERPVLAVEGEANGAD